MVHIHIHSPTTETIQSRQEVSNMRHPSSTHTALLLIFFFQLWNVVRRMSKSTRFKLFCHGPTDSKKSLLSLDGNVQYTTQRQTCSNVFRCAATKQFGSVVQNIKYSSLCLVVIKIPPLQKNNVRPALSFEITRSGWGESTFLS